MIELRQLTALTAIDDHGSFSAAARHLLTVQSNISGHVRRLERTVGATLVDRSTGRLTEEGRAVVARARRAQAEIEAIPSDVAAVGAEVAGSTRLGVIGTTARWLVPPLLDRIGSEHPRVRILVLDGTTTSLVPQLASASLDLAVVNLPADEPDVVVAPLFDEDAVLVAPASHPLADRAETSFAELAAHPLLLAAPGTAFRLELDHAAAAAGVQLQAQAEIDGMRLLASLAFQGFGAAVLPASAAPGWIGGDWVRIPVAGAPSRAVGLAQRKRGLPSAATRAVVQVLTEVVASQGVDQPGIRVAATPEPVRPRQPR